MQFWTEFDPSSSPLLFFFRLCFSSFPSDGQIVAEIRSSPQYIKTLATSCSSGQNLIVLLFLYCLILCFSMPLFFFLLSVFLPPSNEHILLRLIHFPINQHSGDLVQFRAGFDYSSVTLLFFSCAYFCLSFLLRLSITVR